MNAPEDTALPAESEIWIDPDSTAGAAIIDLLRRLKRIEHGDSSWPGGDVVEQLGAWFSSIGLAPERDLEQTVKRLRSGLRLWTVFGLRDNDADGDTLIAAIVPGNVDAADSERVDEDGYQRVAEVVLATTADAAELRALELFEAARN